MKLVSVYDINVDGALYVLLEERHEVANISHREMPDWQEHKDFIASEPYAAWYAIMKDDTSMEVVGAVYMTRVGEIGIAIFKDYQGGEYAKEAIKELMLLHPRDRYLANIAPGNKASISLFKNLGFSHLSETYELHA